MAQQCSHCRLNCGYWLVVPLYPNLIERASPKLQCLVFVRSEEQTVITAQLTYVGFFVDLSLIGCSLPWGASVINRHLQLTGRQG